MGSITEEASRLRANAASSTVQSELDFKQVQKQIGAFAIESKMSEALTDNEFMKLLAIGDGVQKLLQKVRSDLPVAASAISASLLPANAGGNITSIINSLDAADSKLREAESALAGFKDAKDFSKQVGIVKDAEGKLNKGLSEIKSALDQLHVLLFGSSGQ